MPLNDAGIRIEPPWSPPIAMSTSPSATTTALPEDDPPAENPILCGLCTGPVELVWLPPDIQNDSQWTLPAISAPASSMRVTIVASKSGTKPSSVDEPFIIGTPASMMLSFSATTLPFSLPLAAPLTVDLRYQALCRLSSGAGRKPGVRGYLTIGTSSGMAATAL